MIDAVCGAANDGPGRDDAPGVHSHGRSAGPGGHDGKGRDSDPSAADLEPDLVPQSGGRGLPTVALLALGPRLPQGRHPAAKRGARGSGCWPAPLQWWPRDEGGRGVRQRRLFSEGRPRYNQERRNQGGVAMQGLKPRQSLADVLSVRKRNMNQLKKQEMMNKERKFVRRDRRVFAVTPTSSNVAHRGASAERWASPPLYLSCQHRARSSSLQHVKETAWSKTRFSPHRQRTEYRLTSTSSYTSSLPRQSTETAAAIHFQLPPSISSYLRLPPSISSYFQLLPSTSVALELDFPGGARGTEADSYDPLSSLGDVCWVSRPACLDEHEETRSSCGGFQHCSASAHRTARHESHTRPPGRGTAPSFAARNVACRVLHSTSPTRLQAAGRRPRLAYRTSRAGPNGIRMAIGPGPWTPRSAAHPSHDLP
eukprot:scaffold462_cov195-Pinguiococcus_pyrenoidosus.AAC.91